MILVLRLTVLCMVPSWLWLGVDVDCIVYGSQLVMAWCWGCLYVYGSQLVTACCWGCLYVYGSQLVMAWCWGCLYVCGYQLVTAWCWGLYVCGYQLVTAWCWGCMCMVTSWLQFGVEADCIVYGYQLVTAWCWGWLYCVWLPAGQGLVLRLACICSGCHTQWQRICTNRLPAGYSFVLKLTCFSCHT